MREGKFLFQNFWIFISFFSLKKILERDFLFFEKYAGDNKPFVARQKNERIKINIHYIFLIQ
jgi:hypothetical protein